MKKNFILFVLFFFCQHVVFAAGPTVPASNLTFKDLDGARFSVGFTGGNGTYRLVVMKEGSPVTGVPEDGKEYTGNWGFGTAGTEFTQPGEYVVVGKNSWTSYSITNLKPGKTYYVAVFEFNGTGTSTQYLQLPLTGSGSTVVAPTTQASAMVATGATGNTISLSWAKGNGAGRVVVARKGAPVNGTPADLSFYFNEPEFGVGTKIGTDNYIVYKGTGSSVVVKNLEPNTTYHFAVFEYNGNADPVHLTPGATYSAITHAGPTIAPSAASFTYIEGTRFSIGVTVGNGTRRLFIAGKGAAVTAEPVNGVTYNAGSFGAGTEIAPGEFVVGTTTGTGVAVTNLEPNTTYHFRVYEYDVDKAGYTYYLTSSYAVKSGSTATTPISVATNLKLTSVTGSSATVSFTAGNGTFRTVIMKAGSPVDAAPADLIKYPGNANFGSGTQLGTGNYSIFWGMNGSQFTVNNLQPGVTYHVAIYEYNGTDYPVYSTSGGTISFTVPVEPTTAAKSPLSVFIDGKSFRFIWTNGDGAKRIVVARKGAAVSAKPTDNMSYTASENFGQGDELAAGEFVLYNGTGNYFDVKNLEVASTYHFAVFEYNTSADGNPDYLTSSWLATNISTVSWPTAQTVISSVSGIQSAQATINFTKGNGASRIFIMKQGAPVNVEPQDLVKYTYSSSFGTASTLIGDGNYVILLTNGTSYFNVTNLQPNTTYYVSAFEYNGSNEPAYLRTSPATYSFTTIDAPGATTPTSPSVNPLVEGAEGNKFTLKWTNGNGEKRIVVMKQGSAVGFTPIAGTSYTANASFGSGADLGDGHYVVYSGTGNSVEVSNLLPATTYYFTVYESNGTGSLIRYLTSTVLSSTAGTLTAPVTPASSITTTPGHGSLTINWVKGSGTGRIVVVKEGSPVSNAPANLSVYPANAAFKSGSQVATGAYVVYANTGSSVTITNLTDTKVYFFSIFEYNGTTAPVYNTTAVATGSSLVNGPLPITLLYFKAKQVNGHVLLQWATAQEVNNKYFAIERSYDGVNYEVIKTIDGAGNSDRTIEYSYTDNPVNGIKVYYRLRQNDFDGQFEYSDVQVVNIRNEEKSMTVYPNPVQTQFKVILPAGQTKGVLSLFDAKGMLMKQQQIVSGQFINSTDLPAGVYHIKIQAGQATYSSTIVKQ